MSTAVTGLASIQARLKAELEKVAARAGRAVADEAGLLVREATERVPVVTGYLRDSVGVSVDGTTATVSYSAPYADDVHEGGQPWLGDAAAEIAAGMAQRVAGKARIP